MSGKTRLRTKLAGWAGALAALGAVAGCGASGGAATPSSAVPIPTGQSTTGPDLSGVSLPSFVMPEIKGAISQPNPKLTPGSVTDTDTDRVCAMPTHDGHRTPWTTAQKVYVAYGDGSTAQQHKLNLNYLVPIDLGGGTGAANIWPVALRGTGFFQKVETDHVLRDLVCRRTLTLAQAQRDEEINWYAAWLRYVVATGSA